MRDGSLTKAATPNLPPLSPEQTLKLRLLSLLSLAPTIKPLTYQSLMDALSIPTPAELESLVTTAIYSSLLTARLSPASHSPTVNVTSVAPLRDIQPQSLTSMISTLTEWESRCGDVIGDIESQIENIKADALKRRSKERAQAELLEKALANSAENDVAGQSKKSGGHDGGRRSGGSAGSGNKREYSADDNDDDGYFENGSDGLDPSGAGSRMDIDEGAGSSSRLGAGARQAKRILGKKS